MLESKCSSQLVDQQRMILLGKFPCCGRGDCGGEHWLVRIEWRPAGVSASVNLPLHHKVQKFSSGTVSPRWFRKKGRKTVVVVGEFP